MPRNVSIHSTGLVEAPTHKEMVQYVSGDRIFAGNGSEVIWRGAGGSYLFHAGDRYQEAWQLHLQEIQVMGLNTIRLAFAFNDSSINPEYGVPSADIFDFAKMDWVLDFLEKNNLKAILDCHNWADMFGDFGSLKLVDNWVKVAAHYVDDSRIAAYELFNEPGSLTWASCVQSKEDVIQAYVNLTNAIRAVDPYHIVIWQSQPYIPPLEKIKDRILPNIVFTAHRWWTNRKWEFEIWTPEEMSYITLGYLVEMRQKLKIPFWLGEFGSGYPFNSSNPEWLLIEQHLWRCEEQAIGWNVWMGRTDLNTKWDLCLRNPSFFPLKVYNPNLVRKMWQYTLSNLIDHTLEYEGIDRFEPYRIEMWHNKDYVTFEPNVTILVIMNHALSDGSFEIVSKEEIAIVEQLTIRNEEGTETYPGDWNIIIFALRA